ncbi:hypothetical protein ABIF63_006660 [Bradyrhizobium japonicum]|uniref:ABC transporter substrate-binding protein n=1 Tax=Bradyrhizobium japonicum TaxID=375 RepID=A0ABV2S074_BRAJP
MSNFDRRSVLKAGLGGAALLAGPGIVPVRAAEWTNTPEPNASIRVLRWKQFIQAEFDKFAEQTKKFSEKTGVKIKLEAESWEDIRPKAAVAANVGAGPDLIIGTLDDPHKFPEKLIDVTDVADYLGAQYGGWYPVAERYGKKGNSWIAIPQGATGGCLNYRISHVKAAGFEEFPKDTAGFLKLCQALKKNNTPAGFALGHATGDANGWCQWALWAFGGKVVNDKNEVVIDSPETIAALEYVKQLYETFIPGVLSWNDSNNNKAFLNGELSLTLNGISIWTVGKNSTDPKQQEIAKDMNPRADADRPRGRIDRAAERAGLLRLQALEVSQGGQGIHQVHDGQGELRRLGGRFQRLRVAAAAGLQRQPGVDVGSEDHPVSRLPEALPRQRLCRRSRLRLRGRNGRLCRRRHVRGSRLGLGDAEAGGSARRRARQALLSGLISSNLGGVRFAGRRDLSPEGNPTWQSWPSPLSRRSSKAACGPEHSRAGIVSARCSWCRRSPS